MVLAFTEEQKKEIEARGMTVIEFKRWLRDTRKTIDDAWQALKEIVDNLKKTGDFLVEKFIEMGDDMKLVFEQIKEVHNYPTSRRYRIVKIFSKYTGTDIRFSWKIIYKIKRWLARSSC